MIRAHTQRPREHLQLWQRSVQPRKRRWFPSHCLLMHPLTSPARLTITATAVGALPPSPPAFAAYAATALNHLELKSAWHPTANALLPVPVTVVTLLVTSTQTQWRPNLRSSSSYAGERCGTAQQMACCAARPGTRSKKLNSQTGLRCSGRAYQHTGRMH